MPKRTQTRSKKKTFSYSRKNWGPMAYLALFLLALFVTIGLYKYKTEADITYHSLFGTLTPAKADSGDNKGVELGLRFSPVINGTVNGVKFYKASTNTGVHTGSLWSTSGQKLASLTFTNETASGWQKAHFSSPVNVTAGSEYIISYFAPKGHYSVNYDYFTKTYRNDPLLAPPTTHARGNGLYKYSSTPTYPTESTRAINYWVDVVFARDNTVKPIEVSPDASNPADERIIQRAIDAAAPGAVIRINGTGYNQQLLTNISKPVTVTGASGSELKRLVLDNVKYVSFNNLRVAKYSDWGGVTVGTSSAHLKFNRMTIDASSAPVRCGVNANTVRGFQISTDTPGTRSTWPDDIWLTNSDIYGATVDQVTIYGGGSNVHILSNQIHDFRSGSCNVNDEHNDAIQIVTADQVEIRENLIYSPPGRTGGPDQGIIVTTLADASQRASNIVISSNTIKNWPGTAITISGAGTSNVNVSSNVIACAWGKRSAGEGIAVGSSVPSGAKVVVGNNYLDALETCPAP